MPKNFLHCKFGAQQPGRNTLSLQREHRTGFLQLLEQLPKQNSAEQGFYLGDIPEREYNLIINGFLNVWQTAPAPTAN